MTKTWSVPVARIWGVHVRLHLTFLLLLPYLLVITGDKGATDLSAAAALAGLVAAAVALHEAGHLAVARLRGILPRIVVLLPFGGVALREDNSPRGKRWFADELIISMAGPLASFLAAGVTAGILFALNPNAQLLAKPLLSGQDLGRGFLWTNVVLGVVNLFPFYPLDGGRVLRAVLAHSQHGQPDFSAATRRAVAISQVIVFLMFIVGMMKSIPWVMMAAFFLFVAVQMEDRNLIFQIVTENVRLEEIMLTSFATLSPADTLQDALQKAVHSLQDDFPVIRGGDMVGTISKQNIIQALREDGNGYVQSAMKKVSHIATRNESLANAFKKISASRASIIPVVDEERLVGIVTLQNLMHSMGLLAEQRRLQRDDET